MLAALNYRVSWLRAVFLFCLLDPQFPEGRGHVLRGCTSARHAGSSWYSVIKKKDVVTFLQRVWCEKAEQRGNSAVEQSDKRYLGQESRSVSTVVSHVNSTHPGYNVLKMALKVCSLLLGNP